MYDYHLPDTENQLTHIRKIVQSNRNSVLHSRRISLTLISLILIVARTHGIPNIYTVSNELFMNILYERVYDKTFLVSKLFNHKPTIKHQPFNIRRVVSKVPVSSFFFPYLMALLFFTYNVNLDIIILD